MCVTGCVVMVFVAVCVCVTVDAPDGLGVTVCWGGGSEAPSSLERMWEACIHQHGAHDRWGTSVCVCAVYACVFVEGGLL